MVPKLKHYGFVTLSLHYCVVIQSSNLKISSMLHGIALLHVMLICYVTAVSTGNASRPFLYLLYKVRTNCLKFIHSDEGLTLETSAL